MRAAYVQAEGFSERSFPVSAATYKKLDIACECLELALSLYVEGRDYFCVIHLAAAAEELLGMHLPEQQRAFTVNWKAQRGLEALESNTTPEGPKAERAAKQEAQRVVNLSKNSVKHMSETEVDITLEPPFEAAWWLEQALRNHRKLGLPKSPTLWKFEDLRTREMKLVLDSDA